MHFLNNEHISDWILSIFPALLQIGQSTSAGIKREITSLYLKQVPEIDEPFLAEAQPKYA